MSTKLVIILGPNASGKSALGVKLAKKYNGIIISADSRQVFKGLDIGTAKITKKEMQGVPHFMLDMVNPKKHYSAAEFRKDALKIIKRHKNKIVFVVGGSPFYIESLLNKKETFDIPPDWAQRKALEKFAPKQLFERLKKLDSKRAKNIDKNNPRRLIRAIEIAKSKKKPKKEKVSLNFKFIKIGIRHSRHILYKLIDKRVNERFKKGMINEVKKLNKQGLSWEKMDSFGLEYRYISKYLKGELTKDEMVQKLKYAIHDFTRRQLTWFRKDKKIHWLKKQSEADKLVKAFLSK